MREWALELQRRNQIFAALDTVLEEQGFKVWCLLVKLTLMCGPCHTIYTHTLPQR